MASSGGAGGGGVPAERVAAAVNDLVEVREGLARLKSLHDQEQSSSSPWTELMDGMMNKLTTALSMLDAGSGPSTAGSGERVIRQQTAESSAGRARKRSFSRRSQRPSCKIVTETLVDGHVWRKYGQKEIQNSPHPRSYYRCTHKADQGCKAKRHVQLSETDPTMHVVTYYGEHTCRDPSTMTPTIIHTAGEASDGGANNLISFAPASYGTGAAAASQLAKEGNTSQSWCTGTDDVFSSSTELPFVQWDELAAAVVGSAGMAASTVGSAPAENGGFGDMEGGGGGGPGSFPSSPSPSSLRFVVGPLEGIGGDDDLFPFDP